MITLKTRKIRNVPKNVCTAEEKLAYNIAFRIEIGYGDLIRKLKAQKKARIIRNLCSARTLLERNFKRICIGIQQEGKSIMSMPEYIPSSILQELYNDGIDYKGRAYQKA